MSSHHIIRDEQEPPVFVLAIDANWQRLHELLGWSPKVFIDESLRSIFDLASIKYDSVYGFLQNSTLSEQRIQSALRSLPINKITGINYFCGEEAIRTLVEICNGLNLNIPLNFYTQNANILYVGRNTFRKWYPQGQKILVEEYNNIQRQDRLKTKKEGMVDFSSYTFPLLIHELIKSEN